MRLKSTFNTAIVTAGLVISTAVSAVDVTTGAFLLNFDEAALLALPPQARNSAWFDEDASTDKTATEILGAEAQASVPDVFIFSVFGATVSTPPAGLEGRNPVASTFNYTGDPRTGTGKIGLAGVHQISSIAGGIVGGDYDLNYDADRIGNGANGSGWYLTNNVGFTLVAYDLANVTLNIFDENNFDLFGDVVLSSGFAQMLMATEGSKVGTFIFSTEEGNLTTVGIYNYDTQLLTLPEVKVANETYKAVLKLVDLGNNQLAFDLLSATITRSTTNTPSEYDSATGVVTMPDVFTEGELDPHGGRLIKAEMKLVDGSSPLRFMLTSVQN